MEVSQKRPALSPVRRTVLEVVLSVLIVGAGVASLVAGWAKDREYPFMPLSFLVPSASLYPEDVKSAVELATAGLVLLIAGSFLVAGVSGLLCYAPCPPPYSYLRFLPLPLGVLCIVGAGEMVRAVNSESYDLHWFTSLSDEEKAELSAQIAEYSGFGLLREGCAMAFVGGGLAVVQFCVSLVLRLTGKEVSPAPRPLHRPIARTVIDLLVSSVIFAMCIGGFATSALVVSYASVYHKENMTRRSVSQAFFLQLCHASRVTKHGSVDVDTEWRAIGFAVAGLVLLAVGSIAVAALGVLLTVKRIPRLTHVGAALYGVLGLLCIAGMVTAVVEVRDRLEFERTQRPYTIISYDFARPGSFLGFFAGGLAVIHSCVSLVVNCCTKGTGEAQPTCEYTEMEPT